jgi:hypothetical protein
MHAHVQLSYVTLPMNILSAVGLEMNDGEGSQHFVFAKRRPQNKFGSAPVSLPKTATA